ncbi:MAG: hypothetical protein M3304_00675 [Actinomycetota bacterium]|nr:hypothetical protein [Actinomycetota bacterium]
MAVETRATVAIARAPNGVTSGRWIAPISCLALWAFSLRPIEPQEMNDLGLVSVLPVPVFVSLAILALSFCLCLHRRETHDGIFLLHVLALIVMLFGITGAVEEVPRFSVTWRHVGIAEYVERVRDVDPLIDAYFNWPAFFILLAFVTNLTGFADASSLAAWAPIFFNLIYLGPLVMILRTATSDRRLVWLGVWIFYSANWIGQDYMAPQALAFFLYLVILAILLKWFMRRGDEAERASDGGASGAAPRSSLALAYERAAPAAVVAQRPRPIPPRLPLHLGPSQSPSLSPVRYVDPPVGELDPARTTRVALMAMAIAFSGAIVASHQLTPFALALSTGALVVFDRCLARAFPLLTAVLIGTWLSFMAITYVIGHLETITGGIGQFEQAVGVNVVERVRGSDQHLFVVRVRLALTAALWALAVAGAIVGYRRGRRDASYRLLALASFPLLVLQPYGGEMLLRIYLFSLPFVAFLTASLLFPTARARSSWLKTGVVGVGVVALLAGFFIARYGNERMDFFTSRELAGVRRLYEVAPPGSLLIAGTGNLPWKFEGYEKYDYETITSVPSWDSMRTPSPNWWALVSDIRGELRKRDPGRAFLIITRSNKAQAELLGYARRGRVDRLEERLERSPGFRLLYGNQDAKIFVLVNEKARTR